MSHSQDTWKRLWSRMRLCVLVASTSAATVAFAAGEPPVTVKFGKAEIYLSSASDYESLVVTVAGRDTVVQRALPAGAEPVVELTDENGKPLPDGQYTYEIRVVPKVSAEVRRELTRAREAGDDAAAQRLRRKAGLSDELLAVSGAFTVLEGRLVSPEAREVEPTPPLDAGSVVITGDLSVEGKKAFVTTDPDDPSQAIVYVSLEGPEAGTYYRGTAATRGGEARIDLPEHFARVTAPDGLTVQLTPIGAWSRLYVVEKTAERLVVRSADGAEVEFDFLVQGVRLGHSDHRVVQPAER